MLLRQIAAPSAEPLTLAEAKAHLRVDGTAEDAMIALYLSAAREDIEGETGRALVLQDWELRLARFPGRGDRIRLPIAPLASVTSVKMLDSAGAETVVSASLYAVHAPAGPQAERGWITPKPGVDWPPEDTDVEHPVRVVFRCGYSPEAPAPLMAALLLRLGDLYLNREAANAARVTDNPTIDRLLARYRLPGFDRALVRVAWNERTHWHGR